MDRAQELAGSLRRIVPHFSERSKLPVDFQPLRLYLQPGRMTIEICKPEAIFGRHSDCDLQLPAPDVSRHHCRIYYSDGRWHVEDLRSTNGLALNGRKTLAAVLKTGDVLSICSFTFRVELTSVSSESHTTEEVIDLIPSPDERGYRRAS